MEKVTQEFYCNKCQGYFRCRLNMAINIRVVVVCPNCGRKHERGIKNGQIVEFSKTGEYVEEICPPKSAYSKESLAAKMVPNAREGVVIETVEDLRAEDQLQNPNGRAMLKELWLEIHGGGE